MCGCKKAKTPEQAQAIQLEAEAQRQAENQKTLQRWADHQKRIESRRLKLKGAT